MGWKSPVESKLLLIFMQNMNTNKNDKETWKNSWSGINVFSFTYFGHGFTYRLARIIGFLGCTQCILINTKSFQVFAVWVLYCTKKCRNEQEHGLLNLILPDSRSKQPKNRRLFLRGSATFRYFLIRPTGP